MAQGVNVSFLILCVLLQHYVLSERGNFIKFSHLPSILLNNSKISVEYKCLEDQRIGVEIVMDTDTKPNIRIFSKSWSCPHANDVIITHELSINLPEKLLYRPDCFNRKARYTSEVDIRGWILKGNVYARFKNIGSPYERTTLRTEQPVKLLPWYDRPSKRRTLCMSWGAEIMLKLEQCEWLKCPPEKEVVHLVKYPLVLSGTGHGVHRKIPNFSNPLLKQERLQTKYSASFTVSVHLYIDEYCLHHTLCSVIQKLTWNDVLQTPLLLLTPQGKLQVEVLHGPGIMEALITPFLVPKQQWCHLVFSVKHRYWKVTVDCEDGTELVTQYRYKQDIFYNEIDGLYVAGGSELLPAFKGYIGNAILYRRQYLLSHQIPKLSPHHIMYSLGKLSDTDQLCRHHVNWLQHETLRSQVFKDKIVQKNSCSYGSMFGVKKKAVSSKKQCSIFKTPITTKKEAELRHAVTLAVFRGQAVNCHLVGKLLYENVTHKLDADSFAHSPNILDDLERASCYGNHDASFLLATLLNNGFGVRADEKRATVYLLRASYDRHRLSLLTLGNKQFYGLNGIVHDPEQAYAYYKDVADITQQDKNQHIGTDVSVESVRLTNEQQIEEQTDELSDMFLWLKHQAKQGVTTAQRNLGRLMFWGSQGVRRNLEAAVEYYRMGAESNDPTAMFDYGIVLLRGQGTKQNVPEGLRQLDSAAEHGNPAALNAIGWYALEHEQNYTKAAKYFEKSYRRGNAEAAHNIGHMYQTGSYPGQGVDRVKAYQYFYWAATRHQLESGIMLALYHMRGHPLQPQDVTLAVDWARFIAERNPAIGPILRKGLAAFRDKEWKTSMLYYQLAAETGVEIGLFNMAFLCEQDLGGLTSYVEEECVWRNYNLTLQRQRPFWDTYAAIKMGDYYWYGCKHNARNVTAAAHLYAQAAILRDPQGLFNLAVLVEEGIHIKNNVWRELGISKTTSDDKLQLLTQLYSRCQEYRDAEAYLPCKLALIRVQAMEFWEKYQLLVKISGVVGFLIATGLFLHSLYCHFYGPNTVFVNV